MNIYETLDLKEIFQEQIKVSDARYQIYAIVIHKGLSIYSGHYYALVRDNEDPSVWVLINDSWAYSIKRDVNLKKLLGEYEGDTPYLLFYKKV